MTTKTFSKWFSIGAAVLALGSSAAYASDVSADRAELKARDAVAESTQRAAPTEERSAADARSQRDCCAMRSSEAAPSPAEFTDFG